MRASPVSLLVRRRNSFAAARLRFRDDAELDFGDLVMRTTLRRSLFPSQPRILFTTRLTPTNTGGRTSVASGRRTMRGFASRCIPAHRRSAQSPRAPAICGVTRSILSSCATRVLLDTVSTMYAEAVNFPSTNTAVPAGLRGAAEGIERFELASEQSDITPAPRRDVGTAAGGAAARLKASPHRAPIL